MWPLSRNFRNAITGSHSIEVLVRAYRGGVVVPGAADLALVDGSVRADGGSQVRRQLSCRIASPDGRTKTLQALLDVDGTELAVSRGVRYPTGRVELVPVGRFRIDAVDDDLTEGGAVTITAPDVSARVVDDRFFSPRAGNVGVTIPTQITRLIQESIPGALVYDFSGSTVKVRAGIVWERDRWQAIQDLGDSIGCDVFADPTGAFVIAPRKSLSDSADWLVDAGARGILLGGKRSKTRASVYNVVVASSQATDGSTPIYAVAQDSDPLSKTYVGGTFGRVPRFYSSPLIVTTAQAQSAANGLLAQALGARGTLSLDSLVNPALEVGDRLDVFLPDGGLQRHIVDGFDLPLGPDSPMSIATRSAEEVQDS